jgi:Heterokaryon incompatibility protein (HET)
MPYSAVDLKETATRNTLLVRQNLANALSALRYENEPRTLWIDAICIDQCNLEERGTQVMRMGDIYKRAHRVVVWLGPEADDSAYAMKLISEIGAKVDVDWEGTRAVKPSLLAASEPHWADRFIPLPYQEREYSAIDNLIHRSWFERLWIRQEIAFSKPNAIVVCGTSTVMWRDFRSSIRVLHRKPLSEDSFPQHMHEKFRQRIIDIQGLTLYDGTDPTWQILPKASFCNCFDPRDRVYGMLGFIQAAEGDIGIQPDYSLSASEVYTNLVLCLLDFHKRLDIIKCCATPDSSGLMPTWVPNLSTRVQIFEEMGFRSDAQAPASARYLGNGALEVDGVLAATIETSSKYRGEFKVNSTISEIVRLAPKDVLVASYHDGGNLADAFCRTLRCNQFSASFSDRTNLPSFQSCRKFLSRILGSQKRDWPRIGGEISSSDKLYLDCVFDFASERSFFTTKEGFIGLAPMGSRAGDIVCVLLGCNVPLVVREVKHMQYQVVGECYMYGAMDGEVLLGSLSKINYRQEAYSDRPSGKFYWRWINNETGESHKRDPRLLKFIKDGEVVGKMLAMSHNGTAWHRPLLTSQRLKEAGVSITTFQLV